MTTNNELLPCPFCGGTAKFDDDDDGWNWIECGGCQVATNRRVSAMDDCRPLLAEAWNRRQPAMPADEWLKEHEALMHRVSKAAIVVGYSGEGEAALDKAEHALLNHARRIEGDK